MGVTVYAEGKGFFHKGSGGKGVAPGDVCLSPPPPPTGPVPVPYVNTMLASDLDKGSKSVKIDGESTALEDQSEFSTSSGNEGGTQGGNVVTHKTKGKGSFKTWAFTVKVEGKGACRHGDMVGQNCGSAPYGIVDPSAITRFLSALEEEHRGKPCPPNSNPKTGTTEKQRAACRGKQCWSCPTGVASVADHQPPVKSAWYMGGCHDPKKFAEWKSSVEAVQPQCRSCSNSQGGKMARSVIMKVSDVIGLAWP